MIAAQYGYHAVGFIFTDANIPSVFLKAILKKVASNNISIAITVDWRYFKHQ